MTPGVRPLIAGNWKMHGLRADGLALARAVAEGADGAGAAELLVCPPFTLVAEVAAALEGVPHRLHRWGDAGPNPYLGFLAWADAVVVTGDSVSMLSEACATAAPVFVATREEGRHLRLVHGLYEAGQARPLREAARAFVRAPLDETGRVAAAIRERGWV